ncbi:MAG: class I SAM-dependent methyltransferase, partial [Planctomycetota bacterium]|nr:class I SAM-dependent methyltransferase [Planctomycetota bacterium]
MLQTNYDPECYWDNKALNSGGNAESVVRTGDALRDKCIANIQNRLVRSALRRLPRDQKDRQISALDLGCGTGRFHDLAKQFGWNYLGVDISQGMIDLAKRDFPDTNFRRGCGTQLPFEDGIFDLVLSVAVIHHNDYSQQDLIIDEITRVLRSGGHCLLFEGLDSARSHSNGPFFYRPAEDWHNRLEQAGLRREWQRCVRYATIESLWALFWKKLRPGRRIDRQAWMNRCLLQIDCVLDPYL